MDQAENGSSSASSTASFRGFKATMTGVGDLGASLMANSQMMCLLSGQANAMTKMKSNFLESLLQRKLQPSKYSLPSPHQPQPHSDMVSMAALVAASLGQGGGSSADELISQGKSNNLSKLLQNIVEMNQMGRDV
jgi:hypothetical protein